MDREKRNNSILQEQTQEIKKLVSDARQAGMELEVMQFIDAEHCACIWYGGQIAQAVRGDLILDIYAAGDVIARLNGKGDRQLCFVKDKRNQGTFFQEMRSYLANDKELRRAEESGRLQFYNNNWFEWRMYDSQAKEYIGPSLLDNIFDADDILECLSVKELQSIFEYAVLWQSEQEGMYEENEIGPVL